MDALARRITEEQRESAKVLVSLRWFLLAALVVVVDFPVRDDTRAFLVIHGLMLGAVVLNFRLHYLIATRRPVPLWLPLLIGAYDAAAITAAIAVIDGFDNTAYVLYYPALMAFSAAFPGRIGLTYAALIMLIYSALSIFIYKRFDTGSASDWHDLGLRVSTMAATTLLSYLLVRVERVRRMRAVADEAERQREVRALEQRTLAMEQAAEVERRRLAREVHDGVSQGVYMLSLGLEGLGRDGSSTGSRPDPERLDALVRLSKQTLLESRGLLFDLSDVMHGEARLEALIQNQADDFRAITGITTTVRVEGAPASLPSATATEVYRVLRESLANVYRHAGAHSVAIELCHGAATTLRIRDDGVGFDGDAARQRGHGLRNMEDRARAIGADFAVESAPGAGTAITLTIPALEASDVPDSHLARR